MIRDDEQPPEWLASKHGEWRMRAFRYESGVSAVRRVSSEIGRNALLAEDWTELDQALDAETEATRIVEERITTRIEQAGPP